MRLFDEFAIYDEVPSNYLKRLIQHQLKALKDSRLLWIGIGIVMIVIATPAKLVSAIRLLNVCSIL